MRANGANHTTGNITVRLTDSGEVVVPGMRDWLFGEPELARKILLEALGKLHRNGNGNGKENGKRHAPERVALEMEAVRVERLSLCRSIIRHHEQSGRRLPAWLTEIYGDVIEGK